MQAITYCRRQQSIRIRLRPVFPRRRRRRRRRRRYQ
jgi:hypothetical protein